MNRNKVNILIEYLPLTLILSYFFINNIILVLIGIFISLYLVNINLLTTFMRSITQSLSSRKAIIENDKHHKAIKNNSNQTDLKKEDSRPTLVEAIEELGFIPSLDKNDDTKAA